MHIGKQLDELFTTAKLQLQFDVEKAFKEISPGEQSINLSDLPLEQLIPKLYAEIDTIFEAI